MLSAVTKQFDLEYLKMETLETMLSLSAANNGKYGKRSKILKEEKYAYSVTLRFF